MEALSFNDLAELQVVGYHVVCWSLGVVAGLIR